MGLELVNNAGLAELADAMINWSNTIERRRYFREYYKNRRQKQLELVAQFHNRIVACFKCNSKTELEIDHIDKAQKKFNVNRKMLNKEELSKCQLLCRNCHEDKTSTELMNNEHGSPRMSMRCKCSICKTALYFHRRRYKGRN